MKLKLRKVIEILCLNTLAIIIMTSLDYPISLGQTTLPNTTLTNPHNTQETQEPPITLFTIPSNNQDEAAAPANNGISGFSNSDEKHAFGDIALLSQRYISGEVFDKIVGEVLNNGSGPAEFVKVTASFYDDGGAILGSEVTYAYPSTINPGDKSPFNIFITNNAVKDDTETYEFTLQWRDINGTDQSALIKGYQAQDGESSSDNDNIGNNDRIMEELIRSMATERE
jgi:hypothetical protein